MREVYNNSAKASVLLYLNYYGDTKKSDIISILSGNNARYVQRITKQLIESKDIEIYSKPPHPGWKPVRYVRLTTKGKNHAKTLRAQGSSFTENQDIAAIKGTARKEMVLNVYNICKTMGCYVDDTERIPLIRLIGDQSEPLSKKEEKRIEQMQENGAFYSMTEIRTVSRQVLGNGPLNSTRCIGIIIQHRRVRFIYNMGSKLIYFNKTLEQRTKEFVLEAMERSAISQKCIIFNVKKTADCILFGNNYTAIPRLFFKRKKGALNVNEEGQPIETKGKWEPNKDRISIENLAEIYNACYFVSVSNARRDFSSILETTPEQITKVINAWIKQKDSLRRVDDASGAQAVIKKTSTYVYCWFDNELFGFYRLCQSNVASYIVLPIEGPECAIARVMGTKLVEVITVSGKICKTKRYDDTGHRIEKKQT